MASQKLTSEDAVKTYRYLRIGIVAAVVLLGLSIAVEYSIAGSCAQTSISAYYYTPVRAVFVGTMIAVGLALIVIKGRTQFEDLCLNAAGMLAPVVAIVPTTDWGKCWSIEPDPLPVVKGEVADWVTTNIHNNFYSFLLAGIVALAVACIVAFLTRDDNGAREILRPGTQFALGATGAALLVAWVVIDVVWECVSENVHGVAAAVMFVFLIGVVIARALQQRARSTYYLAWYSALAVAMPLGAILIAWPRPFGDHTVFALEAFEIGAFAVFWVLQTFERWDEGPLSPTPLGNSVGSESTGD